MTGQPIGGTTEYSYARCAVEEERLDKLEEKARDAGERVEKVSAASSEIRATVAALRWQVILAALLGSGLVEGSKYLLSLGALK